MKLKRNLFVIALIVMISVQFLSIMEIFAAGPVGSTLQPNPFESNPTVGTVSGVTTTQGVIGNTYDGILTTSLTWRIGSSPTGYVQVDTFDSSPPTSFTIGWVDLKMTYKSSPTFDDRYRLEYQVAPSSTWTVLEYMRLINFLSDERHADPNTNGAFDNGESIYKDSNKDGLVDADIVLAGSAPTPDSVLRVIVVTDKFIDRNTNGDWDAGEPAIRDNDANAKYGGPDKYADSNNNNVWNTGEPAYRDVDNSGTVSTGDIRLAGLAATAGVALKTPPNATCLCYDANGNGVWDQSGGSPYNERAILDVDASLTYTAGDVLIAGAASPTIGIALVAPGTDQLLAGTPFGTGTTDVGKVLVVPSVQDKYTDGNANLVWDVKTSTTEEPAIMDTNNDNKYASDQLLLGAVQPTGTGLIEFKATEKHTETNLWDNTFNGPTNAEGVYTDADNSLSLTTSDVWLDGANLPVGWISGAVAKFNYDGAAWTKAWSKIAEPNDGVWSWTDIGNIKVRVETQQQGAGEDNANNVFDLFEVWATVYEGNYPPTGPGVAIEPPVVEGVHAGESFFIDVFVTDVVRMHGFGLKIDYDTSVLTATDYWTYAPFIASFPSEINDAVGYVVVAYSSFMGDMVGFTGSGPAFRVYFTVDADGLSSMTFDQSIGKFVITNVLGSTITPSYVNNGIYATNGYVRDVAVTQVTTNTTQVMPGGTVEVDVTVANQGTLQETFTVTAYHNSTSDPVIIGEQEVTVDPSTSQDLAFPWDTTGVEVGLYQIWADATTVQDETDFADNTKIDGIVLVGRHDVAVTSVVRAYPTQADAIPEFEAAINDTDSSGDYTVGDVVLAGGAPPSGTVLKTPGVGNKYADKDTDNQWDIGEPAINDTDSSGDYTVGDVVLAGMAPPLGTVLRDPGVGNKYADMNNNGVWDLGRLVEVMKGKVVYVNATVANLGTFTEKFNTTIYYTGGTLDDLPTDGYGYVLEKHADVTLSSGESKTYTVAWNTTSVAFVFIAGHPENWTQRGVAARVTEVYYETDVLNNIRSDGNVNVTKPPIEANFVVQFPTDEDERVVGNTISFDGTLSSTVGGVQAFVKYEWDFGDGTKIIRTREPPPGNFSQIATHIYTQSGKFTVTLKVTNNLTLTATRTRNVTIYSLNVAITDMIVTFPTPGVTKVKAGEMVYINVTVANQNTVFRGETFNVTVSYDSAKVNTLEVNNLLNGTSRTLRFSWNTTGVSAGTYTLKAELKLNPTTLLYDLNKADNTFTYEDTVAVLAYPVASFTYTSGRLYASQTVTFNATGSNDDDGTIVKYEWDFGDGTSGTGKIVTHAFAAKTKGVRPKYTVRLNVTDNDGLMGTVASNVTIYLRDVSVTSVTTSATEVTAGDSVTISVAVANDGDFEETVSLQVLYGNNVISTQTFTLAVGESNTFPVVWETGGVSAGNYTIKAVASIGVDNFADDNERFGDQQVMVKSSGDITLYLIVGAAIAVVIVVVLVYLLKFRKPKP